MGPDQTGKPAKEGKSPYRATLNLPKTSFPMKANLVQNEPASIKRWGATNLYARTREARRGRERFVFHDGPPYANAGIHLGHLMNKCLKDFVVRSQTMMGKDCPYVPGWDCHGLPIEHKVMTGLVESGKIEKLKALPDDARRMAIRRECQAYAEKSIKLQAGQMQRLLTLADYDDPYLTMAPAFEAAVLEVLAALLDQGLVYRALKPVHWSVANETALAEAELEYEDREDISVYVDFEAANAGAVYNAFGLATENHPEQTPSLMIWTTTPWTLPANLAVAVHEGFEYALVRIDGNVTVLAEALVEQVTKAAGAQDVQVLATTRGRELVGLFYKHPFVDPNRGEAAGSPKFRELHGHQPDSPAYRVVAADYVTLEDGTGLVHTAPGHGTEDYMTGLATHLPIYCPVRGDGTYDETVPEWLRGMSIWDANAKVTEHLRESGHLFYDHRFTHSYPHDWRSKTPVIFRCTEQWFVGVDKSTARESRSLRDMALSAVDPASKGVRFVPEWGRNRMRGMLENRPDWCISRQRSWGLPIPAFQSADGQTVMTGTMVRAIAQLVREKGSDVWFTAPPADLLAHYDPSKDPEAPAWLTRGSFPSLRKGPDILDVWFESGSSWNAVMRERSGGKDFPVELYLEGSDQHRGWFQTSLLPALGMMGQPPYKTLLTHGFMVGKDGRKLSKSKGDTVEDLFHDYGVDVLRWWVCSLSYENDVKVDREFFDQAGESYRKVRNTLRFMLSNLDDFEPSVGGTGGHCVSVIEPASIDAWVLGEYDRVARRVIDAFGRYDFRTVQTSLYDFCNDTLSAVYLAAVKDRLYCDKPDSPRRRRTQTVLWDLTCGLSRLLAPVLCHTADEAHRALMKVDPKDSDTTVHLEEFVASFGVTRDESWAAVMRVRDAALQALEQARRPTDQGGQGIENPLDAGVVLPDPDGVLSRFDAVDLADLLGVSLVEVAPGAGSICVRNLEAEGLARCDRSWKRDGTVRRRDDEHGGLLSDRDAGALGLA